MPYTTIDNPELYFQTKLYTGTGSSNAITLDGSENMQPDWVWIKCRDDTHNHQVFDSVRGVHKRMRTDTTGVETSSTESLKSFDSDGFTLGTQANVNNPSNTFASWNWLAGGTASSNTDGSITSTVSANTTSGFSIVSYTGTGSNATVGHGLGSAPKMIIVKRLETADNWEVYHESLGNGKAIRLNLTDASFSTSGRWNNTSPTSSVFSLGTTNAVNNSSEDFIAYCFAEKKGYSKFGSYTGNGQAGTSSPFVYLGFKPAFLIIKNTADTHGWSMTDNKRNGYNENSVFLYANTSDADVSYPMTSFYSNGFQPIEAGADKGATNQSGDTYIYMAFAENPFVTSTGIPSCAR